MKWFSLIMSALYIAAGCAIAFTDFALDWIPRWRSPLAAVLIIYGLARIWIWSRRQRKAQAYGGNGRP
jgi:hypothetical protein